MYARSRQLTTPTPPTGPSPWTARLAALLAATGLLALAAMLLPTASEATFPGKPSAVVFSKVTTPPVEGQEAVAEPEGGLYTVRGRRVSQLTDNPADSRPDFSADGRTIAFVRGGDIYRTRADGSGLRRLTSGPEVDGEPAFSPNGRLVLFERGAEAGGPRDLYGIRAGGGRAWPLVTGGADEHSAVFSPNGRLIVFVRTTGRPEGGTQDAIWSVRPSGRRLRRLSRGPLDEFDPRFFRGGIVFNRGLRRDDASGYSDVFAMWADGRRRRSYIAGSGSAYLQDVSPDGRLVLFTRRGGTWVKRIGGGRARQIGVLDDVDALHLKFSPNGNMVGQLTKTETTDSLVAAWVRMRRVAGLANAYRGDHPFADHSELGEDFAWQPIPRRRR